MKLHLVSYDLNRPGQNYPAIIGRLQKIGAVRIQFSQWMVKSGLTATQLRDDLRASLDSGDRLMVADVTNSEMAWYNLQAEIKTAFNMA